MVHRALTKVLQVMHFHDTVLYITILKILFRINLRSYGSFIYWVYSIYVRVLTLREVTVLCLVIQLNVLNNVLSCIFTLNKSRAVCRISTRFV